MTSKAMPARLTPTRASATPPSTPGRSRGGSVQPAGDPLEAPINRGPFPVYSPPDSDGDLELNPGEYLPSENASPAQPEAEDGVRKNMSTLAINPVQGASATSEPENSLQGLHLNGDFRDLDDAAIMLELKAGNMAGFDFLIQKYRKPIINFMYRMTRNQAVAEELAQEVFLRVYRSRETYRAEARFSTWLYRIATNLGVNQARDTRHERSASTVYLDETDSDTGTTPDVADSTPDVEFRLLRDERMAAIRDHVMALPERQRMAVLMHKYEGMDYGQIGEVLKLSESATKSLLFRAYQTLREKLKGFV